MTILHLSIWAIIPVPELRVTSYLLLTSCSALGRGQVQFGEWGGVEKQENEENAE